MAFSSSALSSSFLSSFPHTSTRSKTNLRFPSIRLIKAASEPEKGNPTATQTKKAQESTNAQPQSQAPAAAKPPPKKPVYSMKKGQIVRVDKEKYLNSLNYLSVGHPPYYKGLDYIYEDRGEVLDLRIFETGEYALVAWVGIPTAPAWLPTDMLIKSEKLNYERL
ncbi:NAD(P)H-quinone oxidoreductase subunit O [Hibiscus syriacus]|uniref:NAD(P)H-quinone oxidoreductase subunit O n=1 Tax=Hibiscus syriacus TaxID=106335 RepID=A0A6A3BU86_HIBSY|nr:NAD(P)H-quinone oxidoreductase subunit O, chloroplastic-like isoform X2 [Hibiscus syriacus]KAE8718562.1 NAD(P)H-quinone oxidoreductase subunit O [Hibiscus syriacus]